MKLAALCLDVPVDVVVRSGAGRREVGKRKGEEGSVWMVWREGAKRGVEASGSCTRLRGGSVELSII
jgi:hypothetical protein